MVRVVIRDAASGDPVLPKHVNWAAKGTDGLNRFGVVDLITVEVQKEEWSHSVTAHLTLSVEKKRYVTTGIDVHISGQVMSLERLPREHPVQEVTGVLLRTIRVAEIARLGALGGIFVLLREGDPPASVLQWLGSDPLRIGVLRGMGPDKGNLSLLGLHYHAAQMSGEPPAKTIEKMFGLPPRTASYWIAKAKAEGYLMPLEFENFSPPKYWRKEHRQPYTTWFSNDELASRPLRDYRERDTSERYGVDEIPAERQDAENWRVNDEPSDEVVDRRFVAMFENEVASSHG